MFLASTYSQGKGLLSRVPLVLLLPPGHSPGSLGVAQGLALPHRFSKPLKDIDAFLNLVVSTVARPEETPRQPQARL
jgi:hypothetical protein